MAKLKFPLEDQDDYKGKLKFTLYENIAPKVTSKANLQKKSQNSSDKLAEGGVQSFLDTLGDAANVLSQGSFTGSGNSANENKTVHLYMPSGMQITDAVQFDNRDIGARGALALQGLQSGEMSAVGAAARAMNPLGEINALKGALANDTSGRITRSAAAMAAQKFGSPTANAVVKSGLQVAVNPNTRAVFQGVPVREFNFAFKMIPTSAQENREIGKIVQFFRQELYPEQIMAGSVSIGYEFPNQFLIHGRYNGKQAGPQFLPCYLRAVNTTFNAQNASFYRDGQFSEIDLSLTFTEVRALTKADIANGLSATGQTNWTGWESLLSNNGNLDLGSYVSDRINNAIETGVNNLVNRFL